MLALRRVVLLALILLLTVETPLLTAWPPLGSFSSPTVMSYSGNRSFIHDTGMRNRSGWQADYRISPPGYFVHGLKKGGEPLDEGVYRYDFYFALRSGTLTTLLSRANDVIRAEAWDVTTSENLIDRTFQRADFASQKHRLLCKSLTFATWGRPGHRFEPRIYWQGLAGVFLSRVEVHRLDPISIAQLNHKAATFEEMMQDSFLDRGFVVLRTPDGAPEELGDTAIWTGLYAAAEAWRYQSTGNLQARQRMERSLWALHELHAKSPDATALVRYVDADGRIYDEEPSKDTYTGFFFAVAQCLPWVRSPELRRALQADVQAIAGGLLANDLRLVSSQGPAVDLNPYFSSGFIQDVLNHLRDNPEDARHLIHIVRAVRWYFWLQGQRSIPILTTLMHGLKHPESPLNVSVTDVLNNALLMLRQLQRNVHRSAVAGHPPELIDTPYLKLDLVLLRALKNVDAMVGPASIQNPEQVKVLPSEALHALHLIKVAADVLPKPNPFESYYRENLLKNKALLTTAMNWSQIDEDAVGAAMGETYASATRTGSCHLTFLALMDLSQWERDPWTQFQYKTIFERQFAPMRSDYNAMLQVMEERMGLRPRQLGLALWSLERYPLDRRGRGDTYWEAHRNELAKAFGGEVAGKARDPIPVDLRPRDAFLWQRSARSIRGDMEDWLYPPLDYLFAYWMARATTEPHQKTLE